MVLSPGSSQATKKDVAWENNDGFWHLQSVIMTPSLNVTSWTGLGSSEHLEPLFRCRCHSFSSPSSRSAATTCAASVAQRRPAPARQKTWSKLSDFSRSQLRIDSHIGRSIASKPHEQRSAWNKFLNFSPLNIPKTQEVGQNGSKNRRSEGIPIPAPPSTKRSKQRFQVLLGG